MREIFNNAIYNIDKLDPFDWAIVFLCVVLILASRKIIYIAQTLFYRYVLGWERMKWVKGWREIEK
jgi:hypothetical protein